MAALCGGIDSGEAVGTPSIVGKILAVGAIASAMAFGSPSISTPKLCGAIPSGEQFGLPSVQIGAPSIRDAGNIASGEAVGGPALRGIISPMGIPSGEIVPIHWVYEINYCGNIPTEESFGSPVIVAKAPSQIRDAGNIASGEAVGGPALTGRITTSVIASGYASGNARLLGHIQGISGIPSIAAVGTPAVVGVLRPGGIVSAEVFGEADALALALNTIPGVGKIPSQEALGEPGLAGTVNPGGITGAEAFGSHTVHAAPLRPGAILSGESFGLAKLNGTIVAPGIDSAEQFMDPRVIIATLQHIRPGGIVGAGVVGTPRIVSIAHPGVPCEQWASEGKLKYLGPKCKPIGPKVRRCPGA